ncbi:hypothetical protein PIB30_097971, partial [Stylosanthes scabra]|nr:hypothetical protein [Stylosanthes scabra]
MQGEESDDDEYETLESHENENSNDNEGKEILRLINMFSFLKCHIKVRIVFKDFVLETVALWDTGADLNCIKEGLIPTKERKKNQMPKKAIVASSRVKGLRLTLLGPIKQSQSTQESLQSAQKSGSSTQQSPSQSTQQDKQTKADYAFPIQTLMALQDQGVTKINKKSWAEICSESDEEIDLTQLITQ